MSSNHPFSDAKMSDTRLMVVATHGDPQIGSEIKEKGHLEQSGFCDLERSRSSDMFTLKRDYFNRKYIFQPSFFRGYLSFQGGSLRETGKFPQISQLFNKTCFESTGFAMDVLPGLTSSTGGLEMRGGNIIYKGLKMIHSSN